MKIRQGFVSNSSSSSFVVVFENDVDVDDLEFLEFDSINTIGQLIREIEKNLEFNINYCKSKNKNPEKDVEIIEIRKNISDMEKIKDRAVHIDVDYNAEQYIVEFFDLLKKMGIVEYYKQIC